MKRIDLRSDTGTLPTAAMLEAIAGAELGDDTYAEDPTVDRLQNAIAETLGKEAGLLCLSGHMANLVALMTHAKPGDEVLLDDESHIYHYEVGSCASVAGLMPRPLPSRQGRLDPADVVGALRPEDVHYPTTRLLCLENTHNRAGGLSIPAVHQREVCDAAREHGLLLHLDGARLFNAAVAQGIAASELAAPFDSVMVSLSKGLSCPLGSVLVGSAEFIRRARFVRRRLGGGMRQAGILAAAGLVALETTVHGLAEDHRRARALAEGLAALDGLTVDLTTVETNMILLDASARWGSTDAAIEALDALGIVAGPREPSHVRLVTHRHIGDADVEEVLRRIAAG